MSTHLSWRRVRALCVKETRQIIRDPSSWLIAVVIPLLLLFIFGYGINLDSSRLRVGILLEQQSADALDFAHTISASPFIDPKISTNRQDLIQRMQAGKVRGIVVIPVDFDQRMARSGGHFWSAALGEDYGFTDELGHRHPVGSLTDSFSLEHDDAE